MPEVNTQGIQDLQPGAFQWLKATITNFNKTETIDLRFVITEFEITEDLAQPIMRGKMVIHDSLSLITRLPIVGGEQVMLSFKTPFPTNQSYTIKEFTHAFVVTAIKHLESTNVRTEVFVMEIASPEIISARTKRIALSYKNLIVSEMVKKICKDYMALTDNKLEIEPSVGASKFVVPNMLPLEAINVLCAEAKGQDKPSNYIFYETRDKYHFVTLEKLKSSIRQLPIPSIPTSGSDEPNQDYLTRSVIDEEYFFAEQDISETDTQSGSVSPDNWLNYGTNTSDIPVLFVGGVKPAEFRRIIDFKFLNLFDIEKELAMGMFDNTALVIDPWAQTLKTFRFNYYNQFNDFKHLFQKSANKLIPDNSPFKNLRGSSHERVILTDFYTSLQDKQIKPRTRQDFVMHRISSLAQLETIILHLVVGGDSERKCGDTIKIAVPEFGATDDIIKEKNKYISGKYLVSSVKHKYAKDVGYFCHLACLKDCYDEKIQDSPGKASQNGSPGNTTLPPVEGTMNNILGNPAELR